eukprot:6424095-Amphidinium_carterae.1
MRIAHSLAHSTPRACKGAHACRWLMQLQCRASALSQHSQGYGPALTLGSHLMRMCSQGSVIGAAAATQIAPKIKSR